MIEKKSLQIERTVIVGLIYAKQNELVSNDYLNELEFYL